jgi:hypothetical protein
MPKVGRVAELVFIGVQAAGSLLFIAFLVLLLPLWLPFVAVGWAAERLGFEYEPSQDF